MGEKEIYQYRQIVLPDEYPSFSTESTTSVVQSIRQIENELRKQQIRYDAENRWLRNVINIRDSNYRYRQKCRHLTIKAAAATKISRELAFNNYRQHTAMTVVKDNLRSSRKQRHANDVYCRILGPSYCKKCSVTMKIKENKESVDAYLNDKKETEGEIESKGRLNSHEKGVYALLPTTSSVRNNHQPGLEYVKKYVDDLQQYRAIPLLSSEEPLRDCFHRAMVVHEEALTFDDDVSKNNSSRKSRRSSNVSNENEDSESGGIKKKKIRKPITPPNTTIVSPSDFGGEGEESASLSHYLHRKRDTYSPYVARTDLEWYHDITRKREKHMGTRQQNPNNQPLDVIELATKLSVLFRERYLPPERSFSRVSTTSSVDHDPVEPLPGDSISRENALIETPLKNKVKSPLRRSASRKHSNSSLKTVKEDQHHNASTASTVVTRRRITFKDSIDNTFAASLGDDKSKIGEADDPNCDMTFHTDSQLNNTEEDLDSLLTESESRIGNICSDSDEEGSTDDDDEDGMVGCMFPIIPPIVNMVSVRTTQTPRQNILY